MDDDGRTCLHYAVLGGSFPVLRYLVDECGFDLSLRTAVSCGVVHDIVRDSFISYVIYFIYSMGIQDSGFTAHYTHDHTYTHTCRTCITHMHTYHTNLPHTTTVNSVL